ncbi:MAG: AraC family transcriptional regulator [Oscillospiraceae bacterium]
MLPFYEYQTTQFQISSGNMINFPPHLHAAPELIYVHSGEIVTQQGNKLIPVKSGELGVFFPNEVHSYCTQDPETHFALLIYRAQFCEELEKIFSAKTPQKQLLNSSEVPPEVLTIIDILQNSEKNGDSPLVIKLYFELLWAKLFPLLNLVKKNSDLPEDLLFSVLSYVSEHFTEPISLESLAKRFGVSRYKISRLFTQNIKSGLNSYINAMRIDKAKSLLQRPGNSVIDVAFACGFESQQTFNRVFKEICGGKPKDFRKEIHV